MESLGVDARGDFGRTPTSRFLGMDVGADRLHVVALDADSNVVDAHVFGPSEVAASVTWASGAEVVAVDAPAMLSTGPHREDPDISRKFRSARCAEIALGRLHRIWVPWATPTADDPISSWIMKGLEVFEHLSAAGVNFVEVYPHAAFVRLAGRRIPSKKTVEGLSTRVSLLNKAGVSAPWLGMWSHDSLDAAVSAVVALRVHQGRAAKVSCGHDSSSIWLP